jgi:tetratricopeptide (TPR) repeat protein
MRSGFSREEAQKLLDEGIAGAVASSSSTPAKFLRMQTENSAVWANGKAEGLGKSWMTAEKAAANTKEALLSYEHAAKGYQQIARGLEGKASDYVKSAEYFAKAGKDKEAMEMLELALKKAPNNPQLKADIEAALKKLKELRENESKNPLYAAQEESLKKLLARVDKPAEVKPAVASTPVKTEPPAPVTPAAPDPTKVTPRDAAYIANDYRLGTNKKPKDPSIAAQYYKRASDEQFAANIKAAVGSKETKFFQDRNIHSAFTESLAGDGKVALGMIEELGKHPNSQPLNQFIWEMQQGNHYAQKTKVTRENMRKIIEKIQTEYKGRLFDPQRNGVRGWDSYNMPME